MARPPRVQAAEQSVEAGASRSFGLHSADSINSQIVNQIRTIRNTANEGVLDGDDLL